MTPYEVVVLAGGSSTRFGSDKLAVLLDSVLAGMPASVPVVCVGPERATPSRPGVIWVRESPPGSGPLAAVGAGAARTAAAVVVLVGGDMPHVGAAVPGLVEALASAADGVDVVALVDGSGRRQPLASAWQRSALVSALQRVGGLGGVPLHRLLDGAAVLDLPDAWDAAHDVDTPADL